MSKEAVKFLTPALRQYQHNDSSDFVFGYDLDQTQAIVEQLQATNQQLVEALEKISGLCERRHNRLVNLERVLSEIAVTTNGAITNAKQQEKGDE